MLRRFMVTLRRFSALFTLADILGFVGFWLYRGTLRRTMGVALALAAVVVVGKKSETLGLSVGEALTGTGVIFLVSCVGGLGLMALGGSFSRFAMTLGEAKGFNLLEEMKKHRKEIHRDKLWRRVFRYEQAFFTAEEIEAERRTVAEHRAALMDMCDPHRRREMGVVDRVRYEGIIRELGRTEEGWGIAFEYGVQVPMGRAELIDRLRYDISQVKNWYDGAPFHHSDNKLREQYDGHEDLREARDDIGYGLVDLWLHTRRRLVQSLWFRTISRAIQVRTAQACARLDRRYAPYRFSIDHFLWPSMLVERKLERRLGPAAVRDLHAARRSIFHRVFHREVDLAHKLMHRAIFPDFIAATILRRRYDPQYTLGELSESWLGDIRRHNRAFRQTRRRRWRRIAYRVRVRRRDRELSALIEPHTGHPPTPRSSYERAMRIAFHLNRIGVSRGLAMTAPRAGAAAGPQSVDIADINRKLLAVRLHHELTRLALEDYEFYLERILRVNI